MSLTKPTRLAKAASYFNVAREEIVQYLSDKGFSIADNPNSKIEDEMFVVLNEKYSSEHDLKEESAQFLSSHNKPKEEKMISKPVEVVVVVEEVPEPEKSKKTVVIQPEEPVLEEQAAVRCVVLFVDIACGRVRVSAQAPIRSCGPPYQTHMLAFLHLIRNHCAW